MKKCVTVNELLQYWLHLCGKFGVREHQTKCWWDTVLSRYSEPQRAYHTMRHLQELKHHLNSIDDKIENHYIVGYTLFFHDIIYDPTKSDNEDQSAVAWKQFVKDCGEERFNAEVIEKVDRYIMQTKNHMSCPTTGVDSDLLYFLDIDLAILAADRERYSEYSKQVREEYIHYSTEAYQKGRTAVLSKFIETNPIYKTEHFREKMKWEDAAKANMVWEIALLKSAQLTMRKITIGDKSRVIKFERRARMKDLFTQMSDEEIEHAIAMNYNLCLSLWDPVTSEMYAHLLTTRTCDTRYSLDSRLSNDIMGDHLMIHSIAVAPKHQRKAVGTQIMRLLLSTIEQQDLEIKKVSLLAPKHLIPFFERSGFHVVAEVPLTQGPHQHPLGLPTPNSQDELGSGSRSNATTPTHGNRSSGGCSPENTINYDPTATAHHHSVPAVGVTYAGGGMHAQTSSSSATFLSASPSQNVSGVVPPGLKLDPSNCHSELPLPSPVGRSQSPNVLPGASPPATPGGSKVRKVFQAKTAIFYEMSKEIQAHQAEKETKNGDEEAEEEEEEEQ